jgi:hypothetical protein
MESIMLCLAPIILLGYVTAIQTSWHDSAQVHPLMGQVQTCKDRLGLHLKAGAEPWVAGGVHYGFTWPIKENMEFTLQPQMGLSYSNTQHPYQGRQITKFEAGVALMLTYQRTVVSLEYTHMSNGKGVDPTNAGLDLVGIQVGYRFK